MSQIVGEIAKETGRFIKSGVELGTTTVEGVNRIVKSTGNTAAKGINTVGHVANTGTKALKTSQIALESIGNVTKATGNILTEGIQGSTKLGTKGLYLATNILGRSGKEISNISEQGLRTVSTAIGNLGKIASNTLGAFSNTSSYLGKKVKETTARAKANQEFKTAQKLKKIERNRELLNLTKNQEIQLNKVKREQELKLIQQKELFNIRKKEIELEKQKQLLEKIQKENEQKKYNELRKKQKERLKKEEEDKNTNRFNKIKIYKDRIKKNIDPIIKKITTTIDDMKYLICNYFKGGLCKKLLSKFNVSHFKSELDSIKSIYLIYIDTKLNNIYFEIDKKFISNINIKNIDKFIYNETNNIIENNLLIIEKLSIIIKKISMQNNRKQTNLSNTIKEFIKEQFNNIIKNIDTNFTKNNTKNIKPKSNNNPTNFNNNPNILNPNILNPNTPQ